jgi:hydroxymethylglutaryl-CoA lyase
MADLTGCCAHLTGERVRCLEGSPMTTGVVKIVECPRDAWQGLPGQIPSEIKADYLRALINAGFKHIDAVSFVSPKAVPQMADAEQVLGLLDPPDDVEIIGIVVNEKGAERAIRTDAVRTLGFPYSVSAEFLRRNQHQNPEEALDALESVAVLAYREGLNVVAYVSMAFGNPYDEPWDEEETVSACDLLASMGLRQISLADTVGGATPGEIASLARAAIEKSGSVEVGVHLHALPGQAERKIAAAYHSGCHRFDMALGGLGGCPFAQDSLVGNVATEEALLALQGLGAELPHLRSLNGVITMGQAIANKFGSAAREAF